MFWVVRREVDVVDVDHLVGSFFSIVDVWLVVAVLHEKPWRLVLLGIL